MLLMDQKGFGCQLGAKDLHSPASLPFYADNASFGLDDIMFIWPGGRTHVPHHCFASGRHADASSNAVNSSN